MHTFIITEEVQYKVEAESGDAALDKLLESPADYFLAVADRTVVEEA